MEDGETEATEGSVSRTYHRHIHRTPVVLKISDGVKKVCHELLPNTIAPKTTRAKRTANGICVGVVVVVVVPPVGVGPGVGPGVVEGHD